MSEGINYRILAVSIERAWRYGNPEADQMVGYLRSQNYNVDICYFQNKDPLDRIYDSIDNDYDCIAFFVTNTNYKVCRLIVERIKKEQANSKIVFCGEYVTRFFREILAENDLVDYAVLGDSDVPMGILINNLAEGKTAALKHCAIASHDDTDRKMPYINDVVDYLPAFDYFAGDCYTRNIRKLYCLQTKNNVCTGNCTFCVRRHGAVKYKPVSQVIEQIVYAHDNYGVNRIFFTDDNIFDPNDINGRKHVVELCSAIKKIKEDGYNLAYQCYIKAIALDDNEEDRKILKLMKSVGFVEIFVGIESANEDDLLLFNKYSTVKDNYKILAMIKDAGLVPIMGFIGFHAYSTRNKITKNFDFLVQQKCIFLSNYLFGFMDVHKYTKIYEILKSDNLILSNDDVYSYVEYDYCDPAIKPVIEFIKIELRPQLHNLRYETDTITEMYKEFQVLYPNEFTFDEEIKQIREQDIDVIDKYLGILLRNFDIEGFKKVEPAFWRHFIDRQSDLKRICDRLREKYTYSEAFAFYAKRLLRTAKGYTKEETNKLQIEKRKCEDISAGYINGSTQEFWFEKDERIKHIKDLGISEKHQRRIVIVLESPHIEEYNDQEPSPAMGVTGEHLQRHIGQVLASIGINEGNYEVILMNGVQFQCSLGECPSYYRDHIWLNMWFNEQLKNDFISRLLSYNPDIIINCCTKGDHSNEEKAPVKTVINGKYLDYCCSDKVAHPGEKTTLKDLVWMEIDGSTINARMYECTHPCSWRGKKSPKVVEHV